jgi:hypothetical protein
MPVEFAGVNNLRKALKEFAPDLDKALKKELAALAKPVVTKARGYAPAVAPLSNWGREGGRFPNYNGAAVKAGISFSTAKSKKNNRGFSSSVRIVNRTAAGAIYETAGRKSGNVGQFTPRLNGQLRGQGQKMTGRAIFRAWAQDQGKTTAAVIKAIETINDKVATLVKSGVIK